ncbi:hypothetical protein ACVDFE_40685 [Lentzea chajnantorensis]
MDDGLRRLTGIASIIFTTGTALHAFVVVNHHTLTLMMVKANADPATAGQFLTTFRVVGCLYIAGNALGVLALRKSPPRWLFWPVLAVNVTQAAGVFMVPPEMWAAAREEFGLAGMLPSLVTDGGALVLAVILVVGRGLSMRKGPFSGAERALRHTKSEIR